MKLFIIRAEKAILIDAIGRHDGFITFFEGLFLVVLEFNVVVEF